MLQLHIWTLWALVTMCGVSAAHGFALLGPLEPWQTPELAYNVLGEDVGAPKDIGEEYRWNVPEITWGVDRAFFEYFGTNGVRAVAEAFSILNGVPPASQLNPEDFLPDPRRINLRAEAANLVDLKSTVLALVVEQLGLASADRYTWTLRGREVAQFGDPPQRSTNYLVINRNFDPVTFEPSPSVNHVRYTYQVVEYANPKYADAVENALDPENRLHVSSAVTSFIGSGLFPSFPAPGVYLTGLSRDDAGGLRYLLHPSNVNIEALPTGATVSSSDTNLAPGAEILRPGVSKLQFTFVPLGWDATPGWSMNLEGTFSYYTSDTLRTQRLRRSVTRPDIVISAADVGTLSNSVIPRLFSRTTPNWSRASSAESAAGPGILQGPVTITLAKLGLGLINTYPGAIGESTAQPFLLRWGSFDSATEVVTYPQRPVTALRIVITHSVEEQGSLLLSVEQFVSDAAPLSIEASSNLRDWVAGGIALDATNSFRATVPTVGPAVFFRVIRQR